MLATIIVVLTAAFILSAVSGVAQGIHLLSNTTMVPAGALALFVSGADAASIVMGTLSQRGTPGGCLYVVVKPLRAPDRVR